MTRRRGVPVVILLLSVRSMFFFPRALSQLKSDLRNSRVVATRHLHLASLAKMKLTTSSRSQVHAELQLLLLNRRTWASHARSVTQTSRHVRQNGAVGNFYTFAKSVSFDCGHTRLCFGEALHVLSTLLVMRRIFCSRCSASENIICQGKQYTYQKTVSRLCLSVLLLLCVRSCHCVGCDFVLFLLVDEVRHVFLDFR